MREISNDPVEQAEQMRLFNLIDARKGNFQHLYKGHFRSDTRGIVEDTIQALKDELAIWEAMLND